MATRREFLKLAAIGPAGLAAVVAARGLEAAENARRRPHILFLMTDQHRWDCLGCAGNAAIKTPSFDQIAGEGVRFTHAYSSTPSCTPARAGILTGLSPWHHGMLGYGEVAERYPFELPRAMGEAGYHTFAIGKLHYGPQRNYHGYHGASLSEGSRAEGASLSEYHKWFKEQAPDLDPNATGLGSNDCRARMYALPEELHPTRWMGDTAVDYVKKYDREEPMFLHVSFARPHSPYDPPKRFWDMYKDEDMPAPSVGKWAAKYAPIENPEDNNRWRGDLGVAHAKHSRRGYYGSVSFIDEQIGRILKALEERGMLDDTLIVYTSDHGDMLGDHNLWRKTYAYEGSAHIPMLVRWPKGWQAAQARGTALAQPVELRDLLPTFLDAAGAKIPDGLDGSSMLRLVRGETSDWREYIDLEHDVCYARENHWNALTDGKWKYVFCAFDGSEQLFDMGNDPGEVNDLSADANCQWTLKSWRNRMVKHLAERGEQFVKDGKLAPRPQAMTYSPRFPDRRPAE